MSLDVIGFCIFWQHIFHYGRTGGSQKKQALFRIIFSDVVLVRSVDFLMDSIHGSCSSWTYKTSMRSDSTHEKRHESISEDWYLETAAAPLHQGLSSLNNVWRLSLYVCFLSRFLKCQVSREKAWTKDGIKSLLHTAPFEAAKHASYLHARWKTFFLNLIFLYKYIIVKLPSDSNTISVAMFSLVHWRMWHLLRPAHLKIK